MAGATESTPLDLIDLFVLERQERLLKLAEAISPEMIFNDNSWQLLGDAGQVLNNRLTPFQVKQIALKARLGGLLSPVIVAGLRVIKLFVFGQGFTVSCDNEAAKKAIDSFFSNERNRAAVWGQRRIMEREAELHTDGNLFLRLFKQKNGTRISSVDMMEITQIVTDPADKDFVQYYVRSYLDSAGASKTVAYPSLTYSPTNQPTTVQTELGPVNIEWDSSMYHIAVNRTGGQWGSCSFMAALSWAKEYERFLEHRATLYAAYAALALIVRTKAQRIAATKTALGENGKSGVKGATAVGAEGDSIEALKTKDSTTPPNEGLQFLEMVIMTFGFLPHFWGKEEPGGMGEKGRNKPFYLGIQAEQTAWKEAIIAICKKVVANDVKSAAGITVLNQGDEQEVIIDQPINVNFPPVTDTDIEAAINAALKITTLDGKKPAGHIKPSEFLRLIEPLVELDNFEAIIDRMAANDEWPDDAQEFIESLQEAMRD